MDGRVHPGQSSPPVVPVKERKKSVKLLLKESPTFDAEQIDELLDKELEEVVKEAFVPGLETKGTFAQRSLEARERQLDKLTFLFTTTTTVCVSACLSSPEGRGLLPWLYCFLFPPLMAIRFFQYRQRKWHYFMLDFCYLAGLFVMVYLIFFPTNEIFFYIMFGITHGPLPFTVIAYKNKLLFHSIDRFTSFSIHVFPWVIFYSLRWYPEDMSRLWYTEFETQNVDQALVDELGVSPESVETLQYVLMPLFVFGIFVAQQALQNFFINFVAGFACFKHIFAVKNDESYMTLFRYSISPDGGMAGFLHSCGENNALKMWLLANGFYGLWTSIPVPLFYWSKLADEIFGIICFLVGIWNAANFYVGVFALGAKAQREVQAYREHNESLKEKLADLSDARKSFRRLSLGGHGQPIEQRY